jgi:hypothetical protein
MKMTSHTRRAAKHGFDRVLKYNGPTYKCQAQNCTVRVRYRCCLPGTRVPLCSKHEREVDALTRATVRGWLSAQRVSASRTKYISEPLMPAAAAKGKRRLRHLRDRTRA